MSDISFEIDNDGVAIVTWDLENRSMNVLNHKSVNEYKDIIDKLVKDDSVKGVVLRSNKDAFIAGADLIAKDSKRLRSYELAVVLIAQGAFHDSEVGPTF